MRGGNPTAAVAAAAVGRSAAALFVLFHLPRQTAADLPVHCLRTQVAGEWEFTLGPWQPRRSSCGHQKPDSPKEQPDARSLLGSTSKRRFSLLNPNTVRDVDDSDAAPGTWTMIYDEGFEVRSGDYVFFAFSKFAFVQDGQGGTRNVSHCGETQLGWYRNTARTRWGEPGCYVGRKVGLASSDEGSLVDDDTAAATTAPEVNASQQETVQQATDDETTDAEEASDNSGGVNDVDQTDGSSTPAADGHTAELLSTSSDTVTAVANEVAPTVDESDLPEEYKPWIPNSAGYDHPMSGQWQRAVAEALNFLQLGWTANPYDSKFAGKTPRQLNRLAGVRRGRLPVDAAANASRAGSVIGQISRHQDFASFLGVRSWVHRRKRESESVDWRSQDGQSWLQPVVNQGDCGSCYTIATVRMLTARHRIAIGNAEAPAFSVGFPLFCSEYTQGCDGGYGFLQSKWAEDVGLLPESCAPYSEQGQCEVSASCQLGNTRYRAKNHHYVGGFYGGSDEAAVRQELVSNGPLVVSFEPKEDFMYYKSGVYLSGPNKIHQEWEQVDHAVLLVGYGDEKGQRYWTMQNSWGEDWGEAGYFRMARGIDESGCESIAVAAEVEEDSENTVLDDFLQQL